MYSCHFLETFLESRTKLKGELLCNVIGERFVFVTCPQHCKIFKVLCSAWHFLKSSIFYLNWSSRIIFHLLTATFFKNSWAIFESEIPLPEYAWPLPTGANLQSVHQQSDHKKSFPSSHYTTLSPAFCYCAPLTRNKGRTRSVPQVNYLWLVFFSFPHPCSASIHLLSPFSRALIAVFSPSSCHPHLLLLLPLSLRPPSLFFSFEV